MQAAKDDATTTYQTIFATVIIFLAAAVLVGVVTAVGISRWILGTEKTLDEFLRTVERYVG